MTGRSPRQTEVPAGLLAGIHAHEFARRGLITPPLARAILDAATRPPRTPQRPRRTTRSTR